LGVLSEGRADGGHVLRDQREFERVVEHVGEIDGFLTGERTSDGRSGAPDGFAHGRSGLQLTVEDDGELADGA